MLKHSLIAFFESNVMLLDDAVFPDDEAVWISGGIEVLFDEISVGGTEFESQAFFPNEFVGAGSIVIDFDRQDFESLVLVFLIESLQVR